MTIIAHQSGDPVAGAPRRTPKVRRTLLAPTRLNGRGAHMRWQTRGHARRSALPRVPVPLGGACGVHPGQRHHPDPVDRVRADHRPGCCLLRGQRHGHRGVRDGVHAGVHPAVPARGVVHRHPRVPRRHRPGRGRDGDVRHPARAGRHQLLGGDGRHARDRRSPATAAQCVDEDARAVVRPRSSGHGRRRGHGGQPGGHCSWHGPGARAGRDDADRPDPAGVRRGRCRERCAVPGVRPGASADPGEPSRGSRSGRWSSMGCPTLCA